MTMTQERQFWTAQELAKAAGVDDSYIRYLLIHGKVQGQKFGKAWMIADRDAKAFLMSRAEQGKLDLGNGES